MGKAAGRRARERRGGGAGGGEDVPGLSRCLPRVSRGPESPCPYPAPPHVAPQGEGHAPSRQAPADWWSGPDGRLAAEPAGRALCDGGA